MSSSFSLNRSRPLLEQPLPPVLNQLVGEFSQCMKQQVSSSDEISRFSDSNIKKVCQEARSQSQVCKGEGEREREGGKG